jgi:hypothetical protein
VEVPISAEKDHDGGLSKAQQHLAALLEELTATVESAEHLTRIGEPEEALRIVEQQRESLFDTVETISHQVGTKPPSRLSSLRRRVPLIAAAVAIAVSGIAISVGAMTSAHDLQAARIHLAQAEQIPNPVARLRAIYVVYNKTAIEHPEAVAAGTAINQDVKIAVTKTKNEMQDDPQNQSLVDQATVWINDVAAGQPMTPPAPSPSPAPTPTGTPNPTASPAPTGPPSSDQVVSDIPPLG